MTNYCDINLHQLMVNTNHILISLERRYCVKTCLLLKILIFMKNVKRNCDLSGKCYTNVTSLNVKCKQCFVLCCFVGKIINSLSKTLFFLHLFAHYLDFTLYVNVCFVIDVKTGENSKWQNLTHFSCVVGFL